MSRLRIALAIVAAALGLASLAAAHDVGAWKDAAGRGSAASTWLPGDPAGRALALEDDVALRRGERSVAAAIRTPEGFEEAPDWARVRAKAVVALSRAVDLGSARQASRAGNLLGVLASTAAIGPGPGEGGAGASATFDAAIRADGENLYPKYNLELLFRRIVVVTIRESPGFGAGNRGRSGAGAGAGTAGAGY